MELRFEAGSEPWLALRSRRSVARPAEAGREVNPGRATTIDAVGGQSSGKVLTMVFPIEVLAPGISFRLRDDCARRAGFAGCMCREAGARRAAISLSRAGLGFGTPRDQHHPPARSPDRRGRRGAPFRGEGGRHRERLSRRRNRGLERRLYHALQAGSDLRDGRARRCGALSASHLPGRAGIRLLLQGCRASVTATDRIDGR